MQEQVASLETQIALMQNDIDIIKNRHPELEIDLHTYGISF